MYTISWWLNSAVCGSSVGRSSVVGPKARHEVSPTVPVQKGLVWEPLGDPPWYSYATASSDWKVGKEIDFRELVYLMNGTLLRVALIGDPVHHRKDILARSH